MIRKIYFSFLLVLFASNVHSQWTTDTMQNTTVRDSSGTDQVTPLSATTSNGNTYISWFESFNGNYQLRMQLLDAAGNKLWAEEGLVVSDYPQNSALYRYDLKVDHNDNAIVAFQDERTGSNLTIVAYMLDQSGNFVWGSSGISLLDPLATQGLGPVIGVTASNNVIVAWNASDASLQWVACKKISSGGSLAWGSATVRIIDSTNTKKFTRPSIVPSGTDEFEMLHVQQTGSFPYTNTMFVQRFDANGDRVWPASVQFSTKTTSFFFFPEAVSDQNGGMYVGFNTSNPSSATLNDVYVQHMDADGNTWSTTGTEAAVSVTTHKTTPALKFVSSQNEIWVLLKVQDSNQTMSGVYVQKFDLNGTALLNPAGEMILPVNSNYDDPSDFESTGNGMMIVYSETAGTNFDFIKAIKIDYTATVAWSPASVAVSSVNSGKLRVQAGSFHNNQVVVVWEDQRIDAGVYAQNIYDDGTIGPLSVTTLITPTNQMNVFPSPSNHLPIMKIGNEVSGKAIIKLTDVSGKVLSEKYIILSSTNRLIDLGTMFRNTLQPGIYFVELSSAHHKGTSRFVIE